MKDAFIFVIDKILQYYIPTDQRHTLECRSGVCFFIIYRDCWNYQNFSRGRARSALSTFVRVQMPEAEDVDSMLRMRQCAAYTKSITGNTKVTKISRGDAHGVRFPHLLTTNN